MKFGSLFAGIGGIDLGLERAGMECAWQVEIDQQCHNLLGKKWPETERFEDVKNCGSGSLESVDLISGGFPCQDVSVAGRRAGLDGKRSGLWFEFHRILAEAHPRWVIIENVPGLLSSNEGHDFAVILRGLADLGYGVAYRVLDAQYFGVAQRRRRVFIIGSLGDGSAAEILFESESLRRNLAPSRKAGKVAPAIPASGAGTSRTGNARTEADMMIAAPVTARQGKGGFTDPANDGLVSAIQPKRGGDDDNDAQAHHLIAAPLRSRSSPNSNAPGRGGEDDENIVIGFTPGNSADSYGIGEEKELSPPVRGGGAGAKPTIAFAQNTRDEVRELGGNKVDALANQPGMKQQTFLSGQMGVRQLTPTECERLQGFPDGWTDGFADTVRYRMLGNAVCVPVAEWIGRRILKLKIC